MLIRLIFTEIQPFENVKIYKEMYGNPDAVRHGVRMAASCSVENFEFKCIVSELVQINPDNSRAVSALTFLLFKLNTLHKNTHQSLSQPNAWCNGSGELSLYHGYYTTITASRRLFSHYTISRGTNQPTTKSEFLQCMKVE